MKRQEITEIITNVIEGNQLHEIGSDVTVQLNDKFRIDVFRSVGHKGAGLKRGEVYVSLERFCPDIFGKEDWRSLGVNRQKNLPPNVIPVRRAATIITETMEKYSI